MSAPGFTKLTKDNLELFLNTFKDNPLPEWFDQLISKKNRPNPTPVADIANDSLTNDSFTNYSEIKSEHGIAAVYYGRGKISYVKTELLTVSSEFTGCDMASFIYKGNRYVCHIANDDGRGDTGTKKFKDFIKCINSEDPNNVKLCSFNPYDDVGLIEVDASASCIGIITEDNQGYSIVISNADRKVLAWVKNVNASVSAGCCEVL